MKKLLLFLFLTASATIGTAQTDSVCIKIKELYNTLANKEKDVRNRYKIMPGEIQAGSFGKTTVYKSSYSIPGFINPQFSEGGGSTRKFSTYMEFDKYEDAVKAWEELNTKSHAFFTGGWTFTTFDEPNEVYKRAKIMNDASMLSPTISYKIERVEGKFRFLVEISY
jgi:hypothetical protein